MQRIDRRERGQKEFGEDAEAYGQAPEDVARRPRKEDLVLNQYEQTIAAEVVAPEDIAIKFDGEERTLYRLGRGLG